MQNPIVSSNFMAMNESVAATCCWSVTNINGHDYESVLNGGYLTTKVGNDVTYKVDGSWLTIVGDFTEAIDGLKLIQDYVDGQWIFGAAGEGTFIKLEDCTPISNQSSFYESGLAKCDHQGDYCAYVTSIDSTFEKTHMDSTVAHTAGGKEWMKPHSAIRFNS